MQSDKPTPGLLHGQPRSEVLLVDIAKSLSSPEFLARKISNAQIEDSFKIPEPRSGVPFDQGLIDRHNQKFKDIKQAIALFQSELKGCLPLQSTTISTDDGEDTYSEEDSPDLSAYQGNLVATSISTIEANEQIDLTEISLQELSVVDIYNVVNTNNLPFWLTLKICIDKPYEYLIPPRSSFLLGTFPQSLQQFNRFSQSGGKNGFDFILLDPPWPNRSAHRAKHQDSYKTSTFDAYDLFKLRISSHLRPNGMIAIWITNSTRWRSFVVQKLFEAWGVELVAEWIWVKVTVYGEPIIDLDNIVRKPYESLLLARRIGDTILPGSPELNDKIILATPDIHSRKPCLKGLIEPYIQAQEPRCCEVFARNLTSGWFSWGNEVLKGNWRGCWV